MMEEMNVSMKGKDQRIAKMNEQQFSRLNLKLDEAKGIIEDAFQVGFHEVMRQAKHFFSNKELNFDLLDSSKFLEDILGLGGKITKPNQL